jgi:hypothetical protein
MKYICIKFEYKDHCIFKYIFFLIIFSLIKHTCHVLEINVPLQKIDFKTYMQLENLNKFTFTMKILKINTLVKKNKNH